MSTRDAEHWGVKRCRRFDQPGWPLRPAGDCPASRASSGGRCDADGFSRLECGI